MPKQCHFCVNDSVLNDGAHEYCLKCFNQYHDLIEVYLQLRQARALERQATALEIVAESSVRRDAASIPIETVREYPALRNCARRWNELGRIRVAREAQTDG
jgi:hypothetical protein